MQNIKTLEESLSNKIEKLNKDFYEAKTKEVKEYVKISISFLSFKLPKLINFSILNNLGLKYHEIFNDKG